MVIGFSIFKIKETYKEKNKTMRNLAIAVTQTLVTCINYIHHYCERIFGMTPYGMMIFIHIKLFIYHCLYFNIFIHEK